MEQWNSGYGKVFYCFLRSVLASLPPLSPSLISCIAEEFAVLLLAPGPNWKVLEWFFNARFRPCSPWADLKESVGKNLWSFRRIWRNLLWASLNYPQADQSDGAWQADPKHDPKHISSPWCFLPVWSFPSRLWHSPKSKGFCWIFQKKRP